MRCGDPGGDRVARLLRELKLDRPLRLLLHHDGAGSDVTALHDIVDAEADQIAPPKLAVDGKVEQCELSSPMIQLTCLGIFEPFILGKWLGVDVGIGVAVVA